MRESPTAEGVEPVVRSSFSSRSTSPDDAKEIKNIYVDYEKPISSRKTRLHNTSKAESRSDLKQSSRSSSKKQNTPSAPSGKSNGQAGNRSFTVPSFVPRESSGGKAFSSSRRESITPLKHGSVGSIKATHIKKSSKGKFDVDDADQNFLDRLVQEAGARESDEDKIPTPESVEEKFEEKKAPPPASNPRSEGGNLVDGKEMPNAKVVNRVALGRTRSLVEKFERRGRFDGDEDQTVSASFDTVADRINSSTMLKEEPQVSGRESASASDAYVIEDLMENHDVMLSGLRSRLTKLQMVRHLWERNDIKGAITSLKKLPDHSVQADVVSILMEKMEIVTMELFSCMLPILVGLLDSKIERHAKMTLEMLLKLVASFGPTIRSTISAPPSVGVDLHQEERIACCKQSFVQLQQIQGLLPALARRGGSLAKSALELNLVLQDHSI
ncbi:Katanin p80 WD40 repeat-containing subunit B1-like protein [Bienertia sinuspersici]